MSLKKSPRCSICKQGFKKSRLLALHGWRNKMNGHAFKNIDRFAEHLSRVAIMFILWCFPCLLRAQTAGDRHLLVKAPADTIVPIACCTSLTLTCSARSPGSIIRAYKWRKISGPGVPRISGNTKATATVSGLLGGVYYFEISVKDNKGVIARDTVRVTGHLPSNYSFEMHSGSPVISANSTSPALMGGDTLTLSGSFEAIALRGLQGGGCNIVIDARNAVQTSPVEFQQPEWYDLHYVKLLGLHSYNWNGTIKASYLINNLTIESCRFINPAGGYKNQPVLQFDNPAYTQMIFTGSKNQTFYNIKIIKCRIDGFQDTTPVGLGSYWTHGTKEVNRSIFLDGEMFLDTIRNITNTSLAINVVSGTGFGMKIHDCMLDSTEANPGARQHNHAAMVLWYGSIDFYNNRMSHNYAAALRSVALGWTGLPGYRDAAVRMYNNIVHRQLSYSAFEVSRNGAGDRDSAHGFLPIPSYCVNNTIDSTLRYSYNGDYYGYVLDIVNTGLDDKTHTDSVFCYNNVILDPEYDRDYDSARRGYIIAVVSRKPVEIATGNNVVYKTVNRAVYESSANFTLVPPELLVDKAVKEFSFRTTDINGRGKAGRAFDLGATEYPGTPDRNKNSSP